MRIGLIVRPAVTGLVLLGMATPQIAFAGLSPSGFSNGAASVAPLVTQVKKRSKGKHWKGKHWKGPKHIYVGPRRAYVRGWTRRPYYGRVVGGVVLGTILGVAIAGTVPRAPSSELCWYWTDPARNRGYWDYCY